MTDSGILEAIKTMTAQLQAHMQVQFEKQAASYHQSMQKSMAIMDARIEDLRLQLLESSVSPGPERTSLQHQMPEPHSANVGFSFSPGLERISLQHRTPEPHSTNVGFSQVPKFMKMEIPKFDGFDPNG